MPFRDSHRPGTPSWVDLATSDPESAKSFYADLFGWSYDDLPAGDDNVYSMAQLNGRVPAAIAAQQPDQREAGVPPHWQMYITVDDVDASAALAAEAGGALHAGPFDVMDAGRMAVLTDPGGAFFMLWTPNQNPGATIVNEPGAFTWAELMAPPSDEVARFYETVTGMQTFATSMPDGTNYTGFTLDGTQDTMVAGMGQQVDPEVPPHWLVYFGTADVDASTALVQGLGGHVVAPVTDISVGRFAVCTDPQGAVFALFQMPAGGS